MGGMNEDLSQWTVARMAELFTPQRAAHIKYMTAMLRCASEPDPRLDALVDGDPGHRMFVYCLDAVARAA
jgi:hypothetical protein